ncbi:MAG: GAF domain-containing protein [Proteobacteria bacterium]|nr:GAF domain-containing protein [Pseudomonadota bacterium]
MARWVIEEGYRSMFSVPLISRDRVLGGVSVYTRQRREFSLDQIHMLCTFANDAAIAIDNARLYEQTRQALAMKSVLLQELHHRVKNNLQMMGSLLRLQMRRTRNAEARKTLAVTHSQIESLGAAHDLLSQDTGASGTSMGRATVAEIARRVADIAVADLLPRDKRITIDTADAQVDVGSQRATLIALVLNELLCNAILHGLEDRDTGHVRVSAKRVVDRPNDESVAMDPDGSDSGTGAPIEHVQIEVVDDGAGLPPGFVLERDAGLGLTIVQRLVIEQLRGALTFESLPVGESGATGTCARLWLPVA